MWEDGKILHDESFADIRARANAARL